MVVGDTFRLDFGGQSGRVHVERRYKDGTMRLLFVPDSMDSPFTLYSREHNGKNYIARKRGK